MYDIMDIIIIRVGVYSREVRRSSVGRAADC